MTKEVREALGEVSAEWRGRQSITEVVCGSRARATPNYVVKAPRGERLMTSAWAELAPSREQFPSGPVAVRLCRSHIAFRAAAILRSAPAVGER